ncbi:MAG: DUF2934 domain-containing protein [Nitrospirae bacterium]|nr:DUF2934 domain-containing protein [Nitrospirota bacterium]
MSVYDDLGAKIAQLAYELYEKSGRIEGRDMENWLKAERIVMTNRSAKKSAEKVKEASGETKKTAKKASPQKKATTKKTAKKTSVKPAAKSTGTKRGSAKKKE